MDLVKSILKDLFLKISQINFEEDIMKFQFSKCNLSQEIFEAKSAFLEIYEVYCV